MKSYPLNWIENNEENPTEWTAGIYLIRKTDDLGELCLLYGMQGQLGTDIESLKAIAQRHHDLRMEELFWQILPSFIPFSIDQNKNKLHMSDIDSAIALRAIVAAESFLKAAQDSNQ